jgi:putative membrane protein
MKSVHFIKPDGWLSRVNAEDRIPWVRHVFGIVFVYPHQTPLCAVINNVRSGGTILLAVRVRASSLKTRPLARTVAWALFWTHLVAQPVSVLLPASLELPGILFIVASFAGFSFVHAWVTRGWRVPVVLFGLCVVLAGGLEAFSVATGFPFGKYVYNPAFGPTLAGVSLLVPVCWFMMGYPALRVAERISPASRDPYRGAAQPVWFVLVAALALTAWDLFLDPQMVRAGLWLWLEPPFYAGIPLMNYFGWVFTSSLIYASYTVFFGRKNTVLDDNFATRGSNPPALPAFDLFDALPVMAYIWTWFGSAFVNLFWWGQGLVAIVGFVGMGVFAMPASLRLIREWRGEP